MRPQDQSQFTPKMKANAVPRLLSSLVWIDQYNECNEVSWNSWFTQKALLCNSTFLSAHVKRLVCLCLWTIPDMVTTIVCFVVNNICHIDCVWSLQIVALTVGRLETKTCYCHTWARAFTKSYYMGDERNMAAVGNLRRILFYCNLPTSVGFIEWHNIQGYEEDRRYYNFQ